jgi:hypothetical protein
MAVRVPGATRGPRPFNSPLECGLRMLFVLDAADKKPADLQRLISYDYLLVHSGDISDGPPSLHPAVPFRGRELLVKRDVLSAGLNQMFSRELLEKTFDNHGITYCSTELTRPFLTLMHSRYAVALRMRALWVIDHFSHMDSKDLSAFMTASIGRWGAEFDQLSAIDRLEL